jgi:hypothetical protein
VVAFSPTELLQSVVHTWQRGRKGRERAEQSWRFAAFTIHSLAEFPSEDAIISDSSGLGLVDVAPAQF